MRSATRKLRALSVGCCAAALCMLAAGSAQAATSYPNGGSTFSGGAEGWHLADGGEAACSLPVLCTAGAKAVGSGGNPGGAWEQKTTFLLNAVGLIKGTSTVESPNFPVTEGGAGTFHLDRQLTTEDLINVSPTANYTVSLIDRTTGVATDVLAGSASGNDPAYVGEDAAATLVPGHTYAISIAAEASTELASLGLGGATNLRFDNVKLTVGTAGNGGNGGNGNNGSNGNNGGNGANGAGTRGGSGAGGKNGASGKSGANGANGLSAVQLRRLISSHGLVQRARRHGNWIVLTGKCPKAIRRACTVRLRGMLNRHRGATVSRRAKIGKGARHQFIVAVRPRARHKVKGMRKILVKEWVRAGKTRVSVYKRVRLVGH